MLSIALFIKQIIHSDKSSFFTLRGHGSGWHTASELASGGKGGQDGGKSSRGS